MRESKLDADHGVPLGELWSRFEEEEEEEEEECRGTTKPATETEEIKWARYIAVASDAVGVFILMCWSARSMDTGARIQINSLERQ